MQNTALSDLVAMAASRFEDNKSDLARHLGVTRTRLYEWETGRRQCPPEKVALIAAAANLPADQWLTRATLWKFEGTEDGERLKKALGKSMRAIGVAVALCIGLALMGQSDKAAGGLFRST